MGVGTVRRRWTSWSCPSSPIPSQSRHCGTASKISRNWC
jgi:hypothetical protein